MLPFDTTELLESHLAGERRPPDGLLHPSGDLIGSLRHAQLRAAGAPTCESELVSEVRLMTGTMWHSLFESVFRKARLPVMAEVRLDRWLPEGWSGTADWIVWDDTADAGRGAFVLGDLKTIKGEGMKFVTSKGMKDEHLWQLSAYWYALERMGLPLVKGFAVYYLPQNAVVSESGIEPFVATGMPLPRDQVIGTMNERWTQTKTYLADVPKQIRDPNRTIGGLVFDHWLNEHLAPEQERVQALRWNKQQKCWDVKLVPHWSAAYCPYPLELCGCRTQSQTKVGAFTMDAHGDLTYTARDGYGDVLPEPGLTPTASEVAKKRKELFGE